MADNTTLNAGAGGDVIATDDIAGVKHQLVKVEFGAADSATQVSATNPLPVQISDGTDVALVTAAGAQVVDGSAVTQPISAVSLPLPTGAATSANQLPNSHDVTVDNTVSSPLPVRQSDGAAFFKLPQAHANNAAFVDATVAAGQFDDTAPGATTENNVGPLRMSSRRELYAQLRDAAGNERGANVTAGNALVVDGSATTQPVSGTVNIGTFPDNEPFNLAQAAGNTLLTGNGVTGTGSPRVTIASDNTAFAVNATLQASTNTTEVVGDVAHSAGASGNPLPIAGIAQDTDDTAPPNRVDAENDATRLASDRDGALFVRPHGPQVWSYHENSSSILTDATVHSAPTSGLSIYVGTIAVSLGAATAFNLFFEEGASTVLGPYYLEAVNGRGLNIQFNPPKKITPAVALTVTTNAAVAHSIDITGFIAQG
jgi:hypothetical protein